jgi:hypothetical protein
MFKNVGPNYLAKGVRVGIHAPWVSHLLFADDCLLFTQASANGARRLMDILQAYQAGSGQMVNIMKSAIFFSANRQDEVKIEVKQITGIAIEALSQKYLGLPTAVGRSTKESFEHIPTKIKNVMGGGVRRSLVELRKKL